MRCAQESCGGLVKYAIPLLGPNEWPACLNPALTYQPWIGHVFFCDEHLPSPLRLEWARRDVAEAEERLAEARDTLKRAESALVVVQNSLQDLEEMRADGLA